MVKKARAGLAAPPAGIEVLAHAAGCRGRLAARNGIRLKEKYPEAYREYLKACAAHRGDPASLLGTAQIVQCRTGIYICSLFAQDTYGEGEPQTDYQALADALRSMKRQMAARRLSSACVPYLMGCGAAGGEWETVEGMLHCIFGNDPAFMLYVVGR